MTEGQLHANSGTKGPLINERELVMITVIGTIASPIAGANAYRIGQDGRPRILPGTGGIVLSHRVGDPCVGIAGDHIEPGVSIRNETRSVKGDRDGPNQALQLLTCIGNIARAVSGAGAVRLVLSPASMAGSTLSWWISPSMRCAGWRLVTASRFMPAVWERVLPIIPRSPCSTRLRVFSPNGACAPRAPACRFR